MKSRNICKFVPKSAANTGENIVTTNFIYESEASEKGPLRISQTHAAYLVISGTGYYRTNLFRAPLSSGMLFFSFSAIPFCIENTGNMQYMYISFSGKRAEELFQRFGISSSSCVFCGYEGLIPLWKDSLTRASKENMDLLSESMLLYAFSKLRDSKESGNYTINQVLGYLEEHFMEPKLSLSSVSEAFGYNSKYLSHMFKEKHGVSFSECLKTLRIRHAVFLMDQGITSIKNVALLSGYADPLYFSKVFKEAVGVSPKQYITGAGPGAGNPPEKSALQTGNSVIN